MRLFKDNKYYRQGSQCSFIILLSLMLSRIRVLTGKISKIIRLTSLLFIVCTMQALAESNGQTVSLNLKMQPIERFFGEIKKQTGYTFIYQDELVQNAHPVTIHVVNEMLDKVLRAVFLNQPFQYEIVDKYIIIQPKASYSLPITISELSQINVRGRVINENGQPTPGVTVTVKGTSMSTVTNSDGEFILETIDRDAILVFTHVSMETFELKVSGKTELLVKLRAKISALSDVTITVSTGYENIPKERATGSFTKIDNQTLNQQTGTNILQRLDGVTSGLYFNVGKAYNPGQSTTNISIRGLSTIEASIDPIIVLDNFPYEGDINNINPNDVESITILKDAAATSIYGARGGNGVIVITTKKGKFNQKPKVEVNSNVIVTQQPDLHTIKQISVSDYIFVEEYLFKHGFFDDHINNTINRPALTPAVEVFLNRTNGTITAQDSANAINQLKLTDSRDQFEKYFYRSAITQQYSANVRGGSNVAAWLVAATYDKNVSNLNATADKLNLRLNNTFKPIRNLQLNLGVFYTHNKSRNGAPGYNNIQINNRAIPYIKIADDAGNPLPVPIRYRRGYTDTAGAGLLLDWKYYPLTDYKQDKSIVNREELIANLGLNYQIVKGLEVDIKYQYQKQKTISKQHSELESYYTRDIINRFLQVDYASGSSLFIIPAGDILGLGNSTISSQNFRSQLNFNSEWQRHAVYGIAGVEVRQVLSDGNASTLYGYVEDPLYYAPMDFFNSYPTHFGGVAEIPGAPSLNKTTNYRFLSVFANAAYAYNDRYTFTVSVRRDGSNIFGANTNDKWKPLWSTGFGWQVSKEKFYMSNILPYLKIKGTIGFSGNVDLRKTPLPVAIYSTNFRTNYPITRVGTLNDPSLRWEKVRQINIGIDFSFKKEFISGSIDFYHKRGTDLYGSSPFDYTAGGSQSVTKNVANIVGKGIDLVLNSKIIDKSVKWSANILLNYNTNKTTKYFDESAQKISSLLGSGNSIYPVIGKPLNAIAAYKWGGLNGSGDPQGYLNGQPSTDYEAIRLEANSKGVEGNIVYIGPSSPVIFGSIINNISWKGFSLSFNIAYRFGYYFKRPSLSYGNLYNNGNGHQEFEQRWMNPGDELITNVPAMVYTDYAQFEDRDLFYTQAEINVLKADHIRFQYANLNFNLKSIAPIIPFNFFHLYFNAANLGVIWTANKENLDPDNPSSNKIPKTFTIGLRINY